MSQFKIMIVEDEINIAKTIEAAFSGSGYQTEICLNGEIALQKLQASAWDIVFLDIKLPGINGMEVLKEICERNIPVQVIMITAYGTIEFAVQAMKYGAVDFIQKPFEPADLREIVKTIAERQTLEIKQVNEYNEFLELCKKQIRERDYDQALSAVIKAIELEPISAEAYNLLGAVHEIKGDNPSAIDAYQKALKLNPGFQAALDNIKRLSEKETYTLDEIDKLTLKTRDKL